MSTLCSVSTLPDQRTIRHRFRACTHSWPQQKALPRRPEGGASPRRVRGVLLSSLTPTSRSTNNNRIGLTQHLDSDLTKCCSLWTKGIENQLVWGSFTGFRWMCSKKIKGLIVIVIVVGTGFGIRRFKRLNAMDRPNHTNPGSWWDICFHVTGVGLSGLGRLAHTLREGFWPHQ